MNQQNLISKNTAAWKIYVWISFGLSFGLTLFGVYQLSADWWVKGYLLMGLIFTVGSCFTLSKTLRDDHESQKLLNRISNAKTEKMLKEYETIAE